jgi:hypothetical protein
MLDRYTWAVIAACERYGDRGDDLRLIDIQAYQGTNAVEPVSHAVAMQEERISSFVNSCTGGVVRAQGCRQVIAAFAILVLEWHEEQPRQLYDVWIRSGDRLQLIQHRRDHVSANILYG